MKKLEFHTKISLKGFCTFKIGGKAKFLFVKYPECISVDDLLIIFETRIRAIGKVIEINN